MRVPTRARAASRKPAMENDKNARPPEPPRSASADRGARQGPVQRARRRSFHRSLLAALPGGLPPRPGPAHGADRAGACAHARMPRRHAAGAGNRQRRDEQPLPPALRCRPCGTAHRRPGRDPQLRDRRCRTPGLRACRPLAGRRLERGPRGHQRHRHLRDRAPGADHPPGRALPQPPHRTHLFRQPGVRPAGRPAGGARRVVRAPRRLAAEPVPHHGAGQPLGEDDRELLLPAPLRGRMAAALPFAGRVRGPVQRGVDGLRR